MDFKKANSHKGFQQTTNDQNEVFQRHVAAHLDGVLHNVLIEQCGIFLTVHCILKVKVLLPTCFVFINGGLGRKNKATCLRYHFRPFTKNPRCISFVQQYFNFLSVRVHVLLEPILQNYLKDVLCYM